jgi:hypothetical protein
MTDLIGYPTPITEPGVLDSAYEDVSSLLLRPLFVLFASAFGFGK